MGAGGGCHDGACTIRYDQLSIAPSYSVPSCVGAQPASQPLSCSHKQCPYSADMCVCISINAHGLTSINAHVLTSINAHYHIAAAPVNCQLFVVGTHRKLGSEQAGGIVHPLPLPALQKPHPAPAVAARGGGGGGSAGAQHGYVVYGAEWCVLYMKPS
jgi:hypothetical protein